MGIDTDAAYSTSTRREDFLYVDDSPSALKSVPPPTEVGGKVNIAGRGPMARQSRCGAWVIDPDGIYVDASDTGAHFAVMSSQRLKARGLKLEQCYKGLQTDVIMDRTSGYIMKLDEERGILVMNTKGNATSVLPHSSVRRVVDDIRRGIRTAMVTTKSLQHHPAKRLFHITRNKDTKSSMRDKHDDYNPSIAVFNEAALTAKGRSRLYARKFGAPSERSIVSMGRKPHVYGELQPFAILNEDNVATDEGKWKNESFKRSDPGESMAKAPYHRLYVDGVGGQKSFGVESYEGAVGEHTFVCPSTGTKKIKLYASHKQFPVCLYLVLCEIEAEGFRCCEIYVDTFSVNISAEAHEVAATFQTIIVPVAAGTPQNMAFVERANGVIAETSRAMQANAPHMPVWCWGVRNQYAVYVLDFLPQSSRDDLSPYFLRTKQRVDLKRKCAHVYGAPVRFSPMGGPPHKRAKMTEKGFFAGVQWPMALVLRKRDKKLISVSPKKMKVYEAAYTKPLDEDITDKDTTHFAAAESLDSGNLSDETHHQRDRGHVQSITSVSSHNRALPGTQSLTKTNDIQQSAFAMNRDFGEGEYSPEHASYGENLLSNQTADLQRKARVNVPVPSVKKKLLKDFKEQGNLWAQMYWSKEFLRKERKRTRRPSNVHKEGVS